MVCCKCNRFSKCRLCACVKAGSKCSDCLPSRGGTCCNFQEDHSTVQRGSQLLQLMPTTTSLPRGQEQYDLSLESSSLQLLESPQTDNRIQADFIDVGRPPLTPPEPNFTWGDFEGPVFCSKVKEVYNEVIHWRRNLFQIPSGSAGKSFVAELAHLYLAYADGSCLENVALAACSIAPILLLQKPSHTSKSKDHTIHL